MEFKYDPDNNNLCHYCAYSLCRWRSAHTVRCSGFKKIVAIAKWWSTGTVKQPDSPVSPKLILDTICGKPIMPAQPKKKAVQVLDLRDEHSRTYEYKLFDIDEGVEIMILHPKKLYLYENGHAFHQVFDGTKVHLCHVPGPIRDTDRKIVGMCKVSWVPKDKDKAVAF